MPRYDTLDYRANISELDPCLAAEVRLKKERLRWKILGAILTILLLIVVAAVVTFAFLIPFGGSRQVSISPAKQPSIPTNLTLSTASPTLPDQVPSKPISQDVSNSVKVDGKLHLISPHAVPTVDTVGKFFESCDEYLKNGYTTSGVYRIKSNNYDFLAQCEMNKDGDGKSWMVMQKRTGDSLMFWNRTFEEYVQGFGDPHSDHWLGLRNVRQLIEAGYKLQLRMDIEGERCGTSEGNYYTGIWVFDIDSESERFRLHVSRILSGNFTDSLSNIESSNGQQFFSMHQEDNGEPFCRVRLRTGGWWTSASQCPFFSMNGEYSCDRPRSSYGLFVYYRQTNRRVSGTYSPGYIHPRSTRMMLRTCRGSDCL